MNENPQHGEAQDQTKPQNQNAKEGVGGDAQPDCTLTQNRSKSGPFGNTESWIERPEATLIPTSAAWGAIRTTKVKVTNWEVIP